MAPGAFASALAAGRKLLGGTANLEIRTARVPTARLSEGFAVAPPEAPEYEATAREVVDLAQGGEPAQPWTSAPGCTAAWARGNPRLQCRRIRRRSTTRATPRGDPPDPSHRGHQLGSRRRGWRGIDDEAGCPVNAVTFPSATVKPRENSDPILRSNSSRRPGRSDGITWDDTPVAKPWRRSACWEGRAWM